MHGSRAATTKLSSQIACKEKDAKHLHKQASLVAGAAHLPRKPLQELMALQGTHLRSTSLLPLRAACACVEQRCCSASLAASAACSSLLLTVFSSV